MKGWIQKPFGQCFISFFLFSLPVFYNFFSQFFTVFLLQFFFFYTVLQFFFPVFSVFFLQFFTKPGLAMEMAGDFSAGDLGGLLLANPVHLNIVCRS